MDRRLALHFVVGEIIEALAQSGHISLRALHLLLRRLNLLLVRLNLLLV
jgi:hypothetical protein